MTVDVLQKEHHHWKHQYICTKTYNKHQVFVHPLVHSIGNTDLCLPKMAVYVGQRAKKGSGKKIQRFGFLGIVLFVMIPLPGTGVYAGSIAAYLFKMKKREAFAANTIGIFFSSVIIWVATLMSLEGV